MPVSFKLRSPARTGAVQTPSPACIRCAPRPFLGFDPVGRGAPALQGRQPSRVGFRPLEKQRTLAEPGFRAVRARGTAPRCGGPTVEGAPATLGTATGDSTREHRSLLPTLLRPAR